MVKDTTSSSTFKSVNDEHFCYEYKIINKIPESADENLTLYVQYFFQSYLYKKEIPKQRTEFFLV